MSNDFQTTFSAWPFRFYVVANGKLALKAQPDALSFHYNLDEIRQWIEANTASSSGCLKNERSSIEIASDATVVA